ncbi:MAG TPA: histidine kinase, partial [Allosphingosinicella sp.]
MAPETASRGQGQRPYWLWLTLAVSAFCVLLFTGFAYLMPGPPPPAWMPKWIAITQATSFFLCLAICGAVRLTEGLPRAWGWAALIAVATGAAWISSATGYAWLTWFESGNRAFHPDFLSGVASSLVIDIWMFSFFTAAQKLLRSMEVERRRDARLAEARIAAGQAQVLALRHQISPHFLFNTLNAISGLIVSGRHEEATAMMKRLSDYFRSSTASETRGMVSLREELAAVEAYLAIERVRFGKRLAFAIDCPDSALAAEVPSFLLQPLVENAVKHAVAPSSGQVTISLRVATQSGHLIMAVEDDGSARKK